MCYIQLSETCVYCRPILECDFNLFLTLQLLNTEVGAESLSAGTVGVCQVLRVDAEAVSGVADAVTLSLC